MADAQTGVHKGLVDQVDPFIGTEFGGEVFVGAAVPFGMVKVGPDLESFDGGSFENGYSSYGRVVGFSHLHLSGAAGKYGNILLMPSTGTFSPQDLWSVRTQEHAEPGYYVARLARYGVSAEMTASAKVAMHRYQFPKGKEAHVALRLDHCLSKGMGEESQRFLGGEIKVLSPREIQGVGIYAGGWNEGKEYRVYFYVEADQAAHQIRTWAGDLPSVSMQRKLTKDQPLGAVLDYAPGAARTLQLKVGISWISAEQARQNVQAQGAGWSFAAMRMQARRQWEQMLARIELRGASSEERRLFYTALYHSLLVPTERTGENPGWQSSEPYYDDYYTIWDSFRSQAPLLTLIDEDRERDLVSSLIDIYRHEGYLPDGRSGNDTGRTQGGSNADVMIADAWEKGIRGIDYATAYEAMRKDAEVEPQDARKWGRGGVNEFNQLGYVASDTERSGSRTAEYSYDNFALAELACGLGYREQARHWASTASNWTNLWDVNLPVSGVHGFLRPKRRDGSWDQPDMQVRGSWKEFFYEGDLWTYSLYAPQDVKLLITLSGGQALFLQRLGIYFLRQHFDISNEPGFLTPMLFNWVGRPDLTVDALNAYMNKYFTGSRAGIPGNDDSGAMSSWYIFQKLGFYPNAGQDFYLIGAPRFPEARIHLANGKVLTILAENTDPSYMNRYIQSATWNGKPLDAAWFRHSMIHEGGTLKFVMGPAPSPWGRTNLPPSLSDSAEPYCSSAQ